MVFSTEATRSYNRIHSQPLMKGCEYMELKRALPEISSRQSTSNISQGELRSLADIKQMPLEQLATRRGL